MHFSVLNFQFSVQESILNFRLIENYLIGNLLKTKNWELKIAGTSV